MEDRISRNFDSEPRHICGPFCLGPQTFHQEAVGALVSLSQWARRADRTGGSFRYGLVFSSRTVRVCERVSLQVERVDLSWHGAMRVGFTSVPPNGRDLLSLAIPELTDTPGHWAAPVPEMPCLEGSKLQFWVSKGGSIYFKANGRQHRLLEGVDLSRPLWAMVDVYGQTCSVVLLGSKKKTIFGNRRSCPAPQRRYSCCSACQRKTSVSADTLVNVNPYCDDSHRSDVVPSLANKLTSDYENMEDCAVCLSQEACIRLPCGHQCLCQQCAIRVIQEFGTCPLCRQNILSFQQTARPKHRSSYDELIR